MAYLHGENNWLYYTCVLYAVPDMAMYAHLTNIPINSIFLHLAHCLFANYAETSKYVYEWLETGYMFAF